MSLSEQAISGETKKLNDFLQQSLSAPKDGSLSDIKLNNLEVNFSNVRMQLDSSLKDYIIEFVFIDEKGHLIKTSSNNENINVLQQPPLSPNIAGLQPLVLIRKNADSFQAHLYRYKKIENNKTIFEYLGEKELPALLLTTQTPPDLSNDEECEEDFVKDNVNIIRGPKPIMTLSFTESGTCYLVIDSKQKTIVPADNSDTQHFQKFVANNCPRNGSLNIEVDERGDVISAYTTNKETAEKKYIKIDQNLIERINRVITAAYSLQTSINTSAPKSPAQDNSSFPAKEVNGSVPSATSPLNANDNQNKPATKI